MKPSAGIPEAFVCMANFWTNKAHAALGKPPSSKGNLVVWSAYNRIRGDM